MTGPLPNEHDKSGDRPLIWLDGEIVPKSQAKISVYDHVVLYGDGVFEGIRVYGGRIFKCRAHLKRLLKSAERIRLDIPYSIDEIEQICRDTVNANELTNGYIRLVATRGVGTLGLHPFRCPKPTVFCIADSITLYPEEMYRDGMPVIVAKRPRIPVDCLDPRIKSCNYLNNILAKIEAIDAGVLEAIMLNVAGEVAECTGDNIFVVKNGSISTPPSDAGILEGVTRGFVMGLCAEHNIEIRERSMRIDEVLDADEVFLTGTAAEVIGVSRVDETVIGDAKEGAMTRRIREAFRAAIDAGAPED